MEDIKRFDIKIYEPTIHSNDDPETIQETKGVLSKIPFAVVGSNRDVEVGGKKVRGRQYPWGIISVENEDHCDFVKLRQMLIRSHMEELKDKTHSILYEQYRSEKMDSGSSKDAEPMADGIVPTKLDRERDAHEKKMAKMEAEMRAVFQQKVAEKEVKLKQSEDEVWLV